MKMKKILCSLLSASLIAASMAVPVLATESTDTITPTMTYVNYDDTDKAYGYIAAGSTAESGYNNFKNSTIGFENTGWSVDYITYLKIDARSITDPTIVEAILSFEASGSIDNKRTCGYGTVAIDYTGWDDKLTYNIAKTNMLSGTAVGDVAWTISKKGTSFDSLNIDITDALKNDDDKIVTIAIYENQAGGGYIKNPSVAIKHSDIALYTVTYDVNGTVTTEDVYTNDTITSIPETKNPGYIFKGWTKGSDTTLYTNEQIAAMPITADTTFTAQYEVDENYIEISISGANSLKAGTSETYTFTATKQGSDVTNTISDLEWKVYDCDNAKANDNVNISVHDGVLTVADGVIPHKIYLRAISASNDTYGSKEIEITKSDSQKEDVYYWNACETAFDGTERMTSVDGSYAYKTSAAWDYQYANHDGYTLTEFDIQFPASGTGVEIMRRDLKANNSTITSDGTNIKEYGGQILAEADPEAWYHIEIAYSTAYASCNIYKYNPDGTLGTRTTKINIGRHQSSQQGAIRIYSGTVIDNIRIYAPIADGLSLKAANAKMFPTEENQITATATKKDLPITADGVQWSVLDSEGLPFLEGAPISITDGLLKATAMAPEGIVTVKAETATASATIPIEILSNESFKMKNIGINEDGDKVVKLYVDKLLAYDDDVVFVMAFYKDGALYEVRTLKGYGSNYKVGDNEIAVDWAIPSGFDAINNPKDTAKVFIWTSF